MTGSGPDSLLTSPGVSGVPWPRQEEPFLQGASRRAGTGSPAPTARRRAVLDPAVTIDMDCSDVEGYGPKKQGVAYNYAGQRCGRPHLATWAEAGLTTRQRSCWPATTSGPGPRRCWVAPLGGIPEQARAAAARHDRLRMRADAGYFTAELAHTTVEHGCVAIEVREALCLQDGDHVLLCRVRHHVAYGMGRPFVQTLIPGARQPSRCAVT